MNKREFLSTAALSAALPLTRCLAASQSAPRSLVRPSDPQWPARAQWDALAGAVGGRLTAVTAPLDACKHDPAACSEVIESLKNPFFIRDQAGATQISGWSGAWTSSPSVYAVEAASAADVAAAVRFAHAHRLRLVVKGGGHSYQGTSNAKDSLLVWTRALDGIRIHDAFSGKRWPEGVNVPAVSIGAGAVWMDVYAAVTTGAGRYVQGGGCATVGVAGLIQSGGFGSFSKRYGLAAAGLLEAEVVTADGRIRVVNAQTDADLFWALKGGGGGTFGVVTRLTLATHALPKTFGDISVKLKAQSDEAFRSLLRATVRFCATDLFNPHWGESIAIHRSNMLEANLVFQDIDKDAAARLWKGFLAEATKIPGVALASAFFIESMPARRWWDVDYLQKFSKGSVLVDPRPGQPKSHAWWTGDNEQVGGFMHAYASAWLPARLLEDKNQAALADALFAASRHWTVSLHLNKGLAGALGDVVEIAGNCATNPSVLGAFALAIISGGGRPDYGAAGIRDRDAAYAALAAKEVPAAMAELRKLAPDTGSYVSESDYYERDWQRSFWGANYPRLLSIKRKYDPDGLFFVHHGVGSENRSEDGFAFL